MTGRNDTAGVNDTTGSPRIRGILELSRSEEGILIGGDPEGLRALAGLLAWLASVDQNSLTGMPEGERFHVHLHARDAEGFNSLTWFSEETEVCRLDAKGTGELPEKYQKRLSQRTAGQAKGKTTTGARKKRGG